MMSIQLIVLTTLYGGGQAQTHSLLPRALTWIQCNSDSVKTNRHFGHGGEETQESFDEGTHDSDSVMDF